MWQGRRRPGDRAGREGEGFIPERFSGDEDGEIRKARPRGKREGECFKISENRMTPFCPSLCSTKWNMVGKKVIDWSVVTLAFQQKGIFCKVNEI